MKTVTTNAIIDSLRSHKDGSLGVVFSTPELSPEEKAAFFELQSKNVQMVITPMDEENSPDLVIDKDMTQKPQSVRMRSVLYLLWKQNPGGLDFFTFYQRETEKLIDQLKGRIV